MSERRGELLEGERVRLRAVEREDLSRLWAFNNDLAVELAGGGDPPMPQAYDRLVAEYEQNVAKGGRDGTSFAIEADGELIGQCALFNVDAAARTCELGITIGDAAYWGRGYGRECVSLLLTYAFQHHNYHKVWLRVHAANARAIRSYQACGLVEEGRLRAHVWSNGEYDDLVFMGILREEWEE
jgi:RimJ/RimL family protein N-acetyltransferase